MSDHDLEQRLRESLQHRAHQLTPEDRLDAIRDEVGQSSGRMPWIAVAAAAAALLVAGGVWWGAQQRTSPPAASQSQSPSPSTSVSTPAPTASEPPTPTPSPSQSPTATGPAMDPLPVYVVAREVAGRTERGYGLRRWWSPGAGGPTDAVRSSMTWASDDLTNPWPQGVTARSVSKGAREIVVTLSTGAPGAMRDQELARLAIQGVVYSVQAVLQSSLPVRFVTEDGSTALLNPAYPTSRTYQRAPKGEEYRDLTDVWITDPVPVPAIETQYPSGKRVVIKGQATAFEAMVHWELEKDGAHISSGDVAASVGAPERGDFTIDLGVLSDSQPHQYTLIVSVLGGESGDQPISRDVTSFSIGPYD